MPKPEELLDLLKASVPPDPDDKRQLTRWHWVMFVGFWGLALTLVLFIFAELGHFSWFDSPVRHTELMGVLDGWERQINQNHSDIATALQRVDAEDSSLAFIKKVNIETSIRAKLKTACVTRDADYRGDLYQEIGKLEDDYSKVNGGQPYHRPSCGEL